MIEQHRTYESRREATHRTHLQPVTDEHPYHAIKWGEVALLACIVIGLVIFLCTRG